MESKPGNRMLTSPKTFFKKFSINTKNNPVEIAIQLRKLLEQPALSVANASLLIFY
jgi:hypothetical protein